MAKIEIKELIESGVHFGHLTRKWNPNMSPYIYMERNGIHIINLYKTSSKIQEATKALNKIAQSGRKILFVATKNKLRTSYLKWPKKLKCHTLLKDGQEVC